MSVSGNAAQSPFPETGHTISPRSTERVRRYRANRDVVRVEVEVPTQDDALAVKRFARQRREAAAHPMSIMSAVPPSSDNLADVIAELSPAARAAVETFARAVATAAEHDLIDRAVRVATNYDDAVRRSSHGRKVAA
ncbi:hypothetical protein [Acidocella aminolytica]|uniref:hypothetical protein n=1 Tax=Acidocella aminolytica TaxID=33998 RepID=UPI000662005B|nr:hypothetical protein [Acidocella aminolytica]SHF44858.1 hypothetical protein SAMN02746095_03300 [Acidocella aminolytica 101 = DSM 11237]